ncbi:hypothetical protein KAK06_06375 [Ideonella sp. 4Y11]|uniref:Uncharacterized protein n=1 Tax=Ideonella aquatica TaxID=2824119 RepID=A0A940YI83_9BURK|nr:hypothetical protein [Ideonella aquatica]MBQ0958581.1 hypothetical protein [Ideonella aquatica]
MPSFVATVIETWAQLATPLLERGFKSSTKQSALGKAVIELEGPGVVASIELWEDGQCLDTTLHRLSADRGSILACGSCQSHAETVTRLSELRAALLNATG